MRDRTPAILFRALCHTCRVKHDEQVSLWRLPDFCAEWIAKHPGHETAFRRPRVLRLDLSSWWRRYLPPSLRELFYWDPTLGYSSNANIKLAYAASSDLTVTNLHSLAASQTFVAGWESGAIDNTSNLFEDYRVTAKLTAASANLQAGEFRLYAVGMLDDSTWPDVFDGTESTETITDTEMRDAICRLAAFTQTDTGNADVYYLDCPSIAAVFNGNLPAKFVLFGTGSMSTTTTAQLASSGNQVTVKGSYRTVT